MAKQPKKKVLKIYVPLMVGSSMFSHIASAPGPLPVFFKQIGGRIGNYVNVNAGGGV